MKLTKKKAKIISSTIGAWIEEKVVSQDQGKSFFLNVQENQALQLKPGELFGLWAVGFPEESFTNLLGKVFESAESHTIFF